MGRDHTIFALQPGYVKYYQDLNLHAKRKYIGITLKKGDVLPSPLNAMRKRRCGLVASTMVQEPEAIPAYVAAEGGSMSEAVEEVEEVKRTKEQQRLFDRGEEGRVLQLRPGYMYRESNWMIGRAAERANIKVKMFKRGDRWVAWRKRSARKAKAEEMRTLGRRLNKR